MAKEWHHEKNGSLKPSQITPGSKQKVWWRCAKGHEWQVAIDCRTSGKTGCPYCAGQFLCDDNRLSVQFPELEAQWHPTKNGTLKASDVNQGSNSKAWWKCPKSRYHEWEAVISSRTRMHLGCPFCAGKKVCKDNCLQTSYPLVAQQWHSKRNGDLTPWDVTPGSNKKVWWKCLSGHVWLAMVNSVVKSRRDWLTTECIRCYRDGLGMARARSAKARDKINRRAVARDKESEDSWE